VLHLLRNQIRYRVEVVAAVQPKPDPRGALERQLRQAEAHAQELRRQITSLPAQPTDDYDDAG
jgi:hypothetical protein